jgi:hypothetical protein
MVAMRKNERPFPIADVLAVGQTQDEPCRPQNADSTRGVCLQALPAFPRYRAAIAFTPFSISST